MKHIKAVALVVFTVIVLGGGLFAREYLSVNGTKSENKPSAYDSTLSLSDTIFHVDVARTQDELMTGLSRRESLGESEGLLFVFPESGNYGFWMKEMLFPIDIAWFDSVQRLIGVSENVQPESYPSVFYPPSDVKYVLELPAGTFSKSNLSIGSIFSLESETEL